MLVDKNNNPLNEQNGQNQEPAKRDARTLPTGTLIYNLIRFAGEEIGIENMIHQLEAIKQERKMVADPPQMAALKEHYKSLTQARFIVANEINERFESVDKARWAELGIEVHELVPPT